jgi:hypothetical protein
MNRRDLETRLDDENLDKKFRDIENEWLARREELLAAREELARLDKSRLERLVKNARQVGVFPSLAAKANEGTDILHVTVDRDRKVASPSPSRQSESLRAWSPELLEERRHRYRNEADGYVIEGIKSPIGGPSSIAGSPSRKAVFG